jgi:hypothetical protein
MQGDDNSSQNPIILIRLNKPGSKSVYWLRVQSINNGTSESMKGRELDQPGDYQLLKKHFGPCS